MRTLLIFCGVYMLSVSVLAQWQAQTLKEESLYNNKTFIIDNYPVKDGIRVKVRAVHRGEPASRPVYLYPSIECKKGEGFKPMDLGAFIKGNPGARSKYEALLGASQRNYPGGVLHVCSLENVNFDSDRIFISLFEPGSENCDRSKVIDLIFPIPLFCEK